MKKLFKKFIPAKLWVILSIIKNNPDYIKRVIWTIKNSGFYEALDKTKDRLSQNSVSKFQTNKISTNNTYILKNPANIDNSLSIAIAVHVYYMDRIKQIMEYIKNIPYKHTLYFTVCEESKSKLNHILKKYSLADYQVIVVENSGYDILPFLKILPLLTEQNHDLVCKIHTKKGAANLEKHISGIDDVWFKTLMDSVLGSKDLVKKINFAFKLDKRLGMIGPASLYKSAQKLMYGNEVYTTDILLNKLSYDTDPAKDWGFFAGSMFWARLEVFKPLIQNQKINKLLNDPIDMKTGRYASVFHGMERVFGKLPFLQCMKTGLTYHLDIKNKSSAIQILDTKIIYSPVGIGMTLQNEHALEKNYNRLKDHTLFDKNFYLEHSATCKKINMDPLLHFLRYGVYQNEMPNENLSPFTFWSVNKKYLINRINPLNALTSIRNIQNTVVNMPENMNNIMAYIKKTNLFDKKHYLKENQDVANSGINPLLHYCKLGYKEGRNPSPEFDTFWYESEYLNQCMGPVNPLLHYILSGKKNGFKTKPSYNNQKFISMRSVSVATLGWKARATSSFNKVSVSKELKQHPKRITLFAAYDPDGIIDESVLIFVKELSKYSDVYFLSDSNLQNSELKTITPFVKGAWGIRHENYDFGSYMRLAKYFVGWETIEKYDELLFVNDSSYLISSLEPVFNKMDKKNVSWWGMQATKGMYATKDKKSNCFKNKISLDKVKNKILKDYFKEDQFDFHIGSYFLVFRKNIIKDKNFQNFINNISRQKNKKNVILKYEIGLTKYLLSHKYNFDTYMDFLYPFHPVYTTVVYEMIEDGFPLFKRFFLTENHYKQKKLYKWKEKLLKFHPDLNLKPIEDNLYRMADASKLYKNLDIENNDIKLLSNYKLKRLDKSSVVNKNWWVFPVCAYNHNFDDNARAVFEEVKNNENIKKIVLYRKKHININGKNIELIPLYSRKAQEYLLKSGIIFIKHSPNINIPFQLNHRKHKFINLWHGIPLKRIGAASLDTQNDLNSLINIHKKCYCTISASDIDRLAMSAAFYPLTYHDIWLTGLPRHDFILKKEKKLPEAFQNDLNKISDILNGRKLILYTPTFRNSQKDGYYKFTKDEKESLYRYLEKSNTVLGIREHMADTARSYGSELTHPQIFNAGNNIFKTIEVLYRKADLLITDYSSCFIDFMLTNKPMISFAYDYDNYKEKERGTFYDLEYVFPGDICIRFDELLNSLNKHFQNDFKSDDPLYIYKKQIFYKYTDHENAKRVINMVKEIRG